MSAREIFIKLDHSRDYYYDHDILGFLLAFNRDLSIIECIKFMMPIIKQDLRMFFTSDFLKQWKIIELVKSTGIGEMPFVKIYNFDYMKMFLDALKSEKFRKYCLIDDKYNISEPDVISVINWIMERFFIFMPD